MAELSRNTFDISKELSRPTELCPSECRTSWAGASRIRLEMVQRKEVQGIGQSGMAQDNRKFKVRRNSSRRRRMIKGDQLGLRQPAAAFP